MDSRRFREILVWVTAIAALAAFCQTVYMGYRHYTVMDEQRISMERWSAVGSAGNLSTENKEYQRFIAAAREANLTYRPLILIGCADMIALIVFITFERGRARQIVRENLLREQGQLVTPSESSTFLRVVRMAAALLAAIGPWVALYTLPF